MARVKFEGPLQVSKVVIPPAKDGKERNYGFVHFEDRSVVASLVSNAEKGIKPSIDGTQLDVRALPPPPPPVSPSVACIAPHG